MKEFIIIFLFGGEGEVPEYPVLDSSLTHKGKEKNTKKIVFHREKGSRAARTTLIKNP